MKTKTIKAIQLRPGMFIWVEGKEAPERVRVGSIEFFADAIFAQIGDDPDEIWRWSPSSEIALDVETN